MAKKSPLGKVNPDNILAQTQQESQDKEKALQAPTQLLVTRCAKLFPEDRISVIPTLDDSGKHMRSVSVVKGEEKVGSWLYTLSYRFKGNVQVREGIASGDIKAALIPWSSTPEYVAAYGLEDLLAILMQERELTKALAACDDEKKAFIEHLSECGVTVNADCTIENVKALAKKKEDERAASRAKEEAAASKK